MNAADSAVARPGIAEEDRLRADIYALLSRLLIAPPKAELLAQVGALQGGDDPFGVAVSALATAARAAGEAAVRAEYEALFIGLSEGELQPYASYYRAGGLYRQPLADLRADLQRFGIARGASVTEPEDHIAILCEIMAALILGGPGGAPATLAEQRRFFEAHIASWAADFFGDLEAAESASFYMPVGHIGGLFLEIEAAAFDIGD
jgi:TorA maturation chaperone TorD